MPALNKKCSSNITPMNISSYDTCQHFGFIKKITFIKVSMQSKLKKSYKLKSNVDNNSTPLQILNTVIKLLYFSIMSFPGHWTNSVVISVVQVPLQISEKLIS